MLHASQAETGPFRILIVPDPSDQAVVLPRWVLWPTSRIGEGDNLGGDFDTRNLVQTLRSNTACRQSHVANVCISDGM